MSFMGRNISKDILKYNYHCGDKHPLNFFHSKIERILGNNQSVDLLSELCALSGLDISEFDSDKYKKFNLLCKNNSDSIELVVDNYSRIASLLGTNELNLDVFEFFICLANFDILDDFLSILDIRKISDCNVNYILNIKTKIKFGRINDFEMFLRKINPQIKFDIKSIEILNTLSFIYPINGSSLFLGIEFDKTSEFVTDKFVGDSSFEVSKKLGNNDFIIFNPKNFNYIAARRLYDNKFYISASMADTDTWLSGIAFKFLISYLPVGSVIIESSNFYGKGSLSGDSLPIILKLFKNHEKFNVDVTLIPRKNWLNYQGRKSNLSRLIIEKMGGLEFVNQIDEVDPDNDNLFEVKNKDDAFDVLNEINKIIYEYTGNTKFYAEIKKFKNKSTYGILIPSFEIVKNDNS